MIDVKQEEITQDITEELLSSSNKIAPGEIIIGVFSGLNDQGQPLVNFAYNNANTPVVAISSIGLKPGQTGRQVALLFVDGDFDKPMIMGLIHSQLDEIIENFELSLPESEQADPVQTESELEKVSSKKDDAYLDGKRVVLEGKEEIVLKCGEASITLTKAGKILIRGKYLLNRSTGVNRIMGGSVQVN